MIKLSSSMNTTARDAGRLIFRIPRRRLISFLTKKMEWALRDPCVLKGTAITSESYWKGSEDHDNACFNAEYYECPDPYAVTEMEEIAVMNAAECFGLKDRVISLRAAV